MKRKISLTLCCGLFFGVHSAAFAASQMPFQFDKNTLAQVETLYSIDENAAITRLAKEYDAAVQARYIEGRDLPGYAGAWFDSDTQGLVVATNQSKDFRAIERAGATPTLVNHSLAELDAARTQVLDALESGIGPGTARESSIDVRTNAITLGIVDSAMSPASMLIEDLSLSVPISLIPVEANNFGFSSNLLGADRTRNATWPAVGGVLSPCSVGASAEEVAGTTYTAGFATAGHCGNSGDSFVANDGITAIGQVVQSTYIDLVTQELDYEDGAWVQTVSPWVPKPQVNGYMDGTLNVSGTWAGMLGAPVGTTVCRYGSTSGGPYCGQVNALNATYSPNISITLYGMIKVHGTCTEDGDSGGPLVMPTGQIQGTDTGSLNTHSCSVPYGAFNVYFQPIATTLNRAKSSTTGHPDFAMLTSHGRSAPTISNYLCPDLANSDPNLGIYACDFTSYDSQGKTDISWTASTGGSATVEQIFDRCSVSGPLVSVTLTVSNPYGTTTKHSSFSCPAP